VVSALATDERATLTNMTAELGGFTGIVEPDAEDRALPARARGVAFESSRGCAATRRDAMPT
jgi:3-isopropylmalate/(R)-2-methylmalate dehydratase large subunit